MRAPPRYLVDTDWLIDYLAGVDAVRLRFEEIGLRHLGVSIVTMAELYEGVIHSRDPEAYQTRVDVLFSRGLSVVNLNDPIARVFGRLRGELRKRGALVGDLDLLIAATALHYGVPLCTNNRRHFERVDGLEILSIG